ncbi:MAG TPA: hypothetical protein VF363_07645 [Candidatus Eisenbacteria bacterium]
MVPIMSLWLPILLSAVVVFIISSIIHMVLKYHASDMKQLPSENEIMESLRKFNIPPGDYMLPRAGSMEAMKSPEYVERVKKGPVATITVMKGGSMSMGPYLLQWFLFCVLVGILAAYITGRAVGPGTPYLRVFRFAGATSFIAFSIGQIPQSIWYRRSWSTTIKHLFDGLIYGLFTGGVFGWLWPK